jgi:hypothetical protein
VGFHDETQIVRVSRNGFSSAHGMLYLETDAAAEII